MFQVSIPSLGETILLPIQTYMTCTIYVSMNCTHVHMHVHVHVYVHCQALTMYINTTTTQDAQTTRYY